MSSFWRGALAFSVRILYVLLIFSLLPLIRPTSIYAGPVSAQTDDSTSTVYLPSVMNSPVSAPAGPGEWPMAGANPQRTSWTSTEVKGSLKAEWFTHFDAYISQKVQVIAANKRLYISASDGLHALDSNNGQRLWFFPTSLPLGNSPTYQDKVVYVGGFDRRLYAINADTGREIWRFEAGAGFETNPLVANGMVYAGNRDGYFYALDMYSGQLAWRFKTGGPILYSAAYKNGVLYFASNDMFAYALNASSGSLIWKSAKLPGRGFHSWWPVIYDNYVVFSGSYNYRFPAPYGNASHLILDQAAYPANVPNGTPIGTFGTEPGTWATGTRTMDVSRISQYYETYPHRRTTILLNASNGQELTYDSDRDGKPEYAPYLFFGIHSGTRYPPVIGKDGVMYQSNSYIADQYIPRGHLTGWKLGTPIVSVPTKAINAVDEPMGYAIGGNTVYWKRCCDRLAGSFDLISGSSSVYFDEGGIRLRRTLPALFQKGWEFSYWKHGDTTPPIPYNGRVYTINNNAVVAFSPNGKDPVLPLEENTGRATGLPPADIERSNTYTGLNTKLTISTNTWPLLFQQERYYEFQEEFTTRAAHFKLFEVAGAATGSPTAMRITEGFITTQVASTHSGSQTLNAWVSKRAPAMLFQNSSSTYQLRGRFAAFAYPSSSGIQVRSGSATINGADLSESWLLAWDGTADHRWMPVVISLQNRPSQIKLDSAGLTMTYPAASGYLAVTPLYGMRAPRTTEVNTWPSGIPQATVDRARLFNRAARAFPASSTDNLVIDSQSGDAEWTYTYQFATFTDAWNTSPLQIAYLPPQTALAAWNGSPIQINGGSYQNVTDMTFITPIGRAGGPANTNVARVRLPGIANYWRQTPGTPSLPSGDPVQERLISEVQKMLQAGHLLPGYGQTGIWDSKARDRLGPYLADYWHNPAETVYTLTRALPLLPSELQEQVRQYLTREFAAYPTHSVSHVGWASGALRDAFNLPPEVEADRKNFPACGSCNAWGIPAENAYASWMYAAKFGSAAPIFTATAANFNLNPRFQQSLPYSLNSQIAGTIGYLRLASLANAGVQPVAEKSLVNLLTLRAALSKYPAALQAMGFEYGGYKWAMRTYAPNMPDTLFVLRTMGTLWSQTPLYGFKLDTIYGLSGPAQGGAYVFGIDYINMVPEQASFMRAYVGAEEQAAIADHERRTPYWFVSKSEEAAGEGTIHPIYETISLFNAKAMILGASRTELEQYLDVPAVPVGDLYYIQKLIMTLEAGQ